MKLSWSALLAVLASRDISLKPPYSKESSGHNFKNKAIEATLELVKKIKQSSFIVLGQTDKLKILPRDGTRDKPWQSRKGRSNTEKRRSKTRKDVLKQKIWYFFLKNFNQFYPGTKGQRDVLSLGINRLSATSLVLRLTTVLYGKTV